MSKDLFSAHLYQTSWGSLTALRPQWAFASAETDPSATPRSPLASD